MFINKIGMEHLEMGMNCQDYGIIGDTWAVVCDGCSDGKHSEVGAKLFCQLYKDCGDTKERSRNGLQADLPWKRTIGRDSAKGGI